MMQLLKYGIILLVTVCIMTIVALEINFEIISYLTIYAFFGVGLFYFLKYHKFYRLQSGVILGIILTSLIPTYILTASIVTTQTDIAYSKVKSIPKENLIEFYNTNNINAIPRNKRRVWIGVFYKNITVVSENKLKNIKAVGWQGNSVFAYYNIEEDAYVGSYH